MCTAMSRNLDKRRGSMLLEALLSVMILSVSMTLVIRSMSQSARAAAYSAEYFRSLFLLENQMADIVGSPQEYAGAVKSGRLPYPYEDYRYQASAAPVAGAGLENLKELTFDLSWSRGERFNNLKLITYLAIPETE